MANLDGTATSIELAPGYRIAAPGLRGTVTVRDGREPTVTRGGPELATEALDQALTGAGFNEIKSIELDVSGVPLPPGERPIRTSGGEEGLVLELPDLGDTVGQIVLAVDEDGVVTWNFPRSTVGVVETPTTRGAGGTKRFVIRGSVPPPPQTDEKPRRGLVGIVGRKILKVLVYPVADAVLGPISSHFAGKWESKHRPYRVRDFGPTNYSRVETAELDPSGWERLATGRALLFVHGTFSTAHGGFGGLPIPTMERLHDAYGGRVFAFDHPTLADDPLENVRAFSERIPQGTALDLDIVCHSRGGLISRAMAGELPDVSLPELRLRRVVFVGTPNHGTALTDPDHMVAFIDRYTSLLNLFPPGPLSVVAEILDAITVVVKLIGHSALSGLHGLAAMDPGGGFLRRLNDGRAVDTRYYAITADFEPRGGLREMVKQALADGVMDRVFGGEANDLVVPMRGVYEGSTDPGFPIPEERRLTFGGDAGVSHIGYFARPETAGTLEEWLIPDG